MQLLLRHTGFDNHPAVLGIELTDPVHPAKIHQHLAVSNRCAVAIPDVEASAHRVERQSVAVGYLDNAAHLGGAGRPDHSQNPPLETQGVFSHMAKLIIRPGNMIGTQERAELFNRITIQHPPILTEVSSGRRRTGNHTKTHMVEMPYCVRSITRDW